jgi:xanthine dehydrogenase accessory factor
VAVHALDARLVPRLADAVATDRPVALTLRLDDGGFGDQRLLARGDDDAVDALLDLGESGIVENRNGEVVFVESFAPRPNLYVFGASDHVAALARAGRFLGYRVTVCDARGSLLARGRFPDADEVVAEWPDRFLERAAVDARTAICVLTHDDKFDVPALKRALESPAGYIGAIGSSRTAAEREERLRAEGVGEPELARLHAPIGLAVGARSPEEVAIAIAAQLVESNAAARKVRATSVARATVLT